MATINPDGTITADGLTGSIHGVGAKVADLPACNGWAHWTYEDPAGGARKLIDELRKQAREADCGA